MASENKMVENKIVVVVAMDKVRGGKIYENNYQKLIEDPKFSVPARLSNSTRIKQRRILA